MSGKGSKQRPINDRKKFDSEWDRIFGKNIPSHDATEFFETSPREPIPERANWYGFAEEDTSSSIDSKYAHPAYTRYPFLKNKLVKE